MTWTLGMLSAALAGTAPVGLVGGATLVAGPPSLGGGTAARLWIDLDVIGLEAGLREALVTSDPRLVGTVFFGLRRMIGRSAYVRVGFAHHHESDWDLLGTDLGGALFGVAPGIVHRSGAELGGGLVWPFTGTQIEDRAGIVGDLAVAWMPDLTRPNVYTFLETSLIVWVGPRPEE